MRTSPFAAGMFIPTSRLRIPPDVESTPSVGQVKSQFHGSHGAQRIWKALEEGFAGQTAAFILGQFRALQHAAAAVIAVTSDRAN